MLKVTIYFKDGTKEVKEFRTRTGIINYIMFTDKTIEKWEVK